MGNAGSHGINAAIYSDIPYDVMKDFVPVTLVYRAPNIFVASPKFPIKSMSELIAYARRTRQSQLCIRWQRVISAYECRVPQGSVRN